MTTGTNALLMLLAMGIESPALVIAPIPVAIDFTAPAGCSSLESFYLGVRSRTDRVRLANPGEQGVQIRVRVFRVGPNIRGELRIGDQQEESETRRVDGISCNEVVEALSLTAALALDPSASLLAERNPTPERSTPALADTVAPAVMPSASNTPRAPLPAIRGDESPTPWVSAHSQFSSGTDFDLSTQAFAAGYLTPGLLLGPQVGIRFIAPTRYRTNLTAGVQGFFLSNNLLGAADTAVFQMAGIGLSMCPAYGTLGHWIELGACAIARGASLRASGLGLTHPQTVSRSWWGLGLESLVSLRLHEHWGLELSAGFVTPLIVREFKSGTGSQALDVGKTPIIGAQTGVGVAFRF